LGYSQFKITLKKGFKKGFKKDLKKRKGKNLWITKKMIKNSSYKNKVYLSLNG